MTKVLSGVVSIVSLLSLSTILTVTLDLPKNELQAQTIKTNSRVNAQGQSDKHYGQFMRRPKPSPQNPSNNQKVHRAKIKRRAGGTPVIDVVFNGSKTFEMIVDTGASGTLITQPMARTLGVRPVGKMKAGIADGSVVEFDLGRVQSISVAGAVVKNVDVAIADRMDIGLLGHDFFGNYDVKIKKDVVEFYPR